MNHETMLAFLMGQRRGGGSSGGGGKQGSLMVIKDVVVPASSTVQVSHIGPAIGDGGYIPGTPILYACRSYNSNSDMSGMVYLNASTSDYTLAQGEYEVCITHEKS